MPLEHVFVIGISYYSTITKPASLKIYLAHLNNFLHTALNNFTKTL